MSINKGKGLTKKKGSVKAKSKYARRRLRRIRKSQKRLKSNRILKKERFLTKRKLSRKLKHLTKDLYYISETDADITPFLGGKQKNLNINTFLEQIIESIDTPIEQVNFDDFFRHLITMQDWFNDERIKMTKKYQQIKKLLQDNLKDLSIFKVGKIRLDIYVVGLDKRNNLVGIKTKAIET